jgi:hypothetical protein
MIETRFRFQTADGRLFLVRVHGNETVEVDEKVKSPAGVMVWTPLHLLGGKLLDVRDD